MSVGSEHTVAETSSASCGHHHHHGGGHHDHAHAVDTSSADGRRRVAIAGLLTFAFMFAEVVGGVISNSLALIADAGHMLTDAASLGLAWLGYRLSMRPAAGNRTFGYGRYRILAAFVNGIVLLMLAGWIVYEGIERLFSPQPVMAPLLLAVAVLGLIVNLISFTVLHGGEHHDDLNLRGALWHVAGDLLGSVAAILAALVIMWTSWYPIDPLLSLLVAGIILVAGIRITREAGRILAEEAPITVQVDEIREQLGKQLGENVTVETLRIWSITENETQVAGRFRLGADANFIRVRVG
ncbi:MAG: cation diffusion facilitator family transporter, partial [Pseudomonadota bacterium]